jgi:type III secretion protein C
VHVPNGHFLILSGFVNNTTTRRKSGIPCLGGLPLIGSAFSQDNDTQSDYNMVIFMHPKIIHSLEDMKKLASDQEDYFRDQAGTPSLKKNFEEAMELIKSPEDD